MKLFAQVIVAAGLVFAWPGPWIAQWMDAPPATFLGPDVLPLRPAAPVPAELRNSFGSDARAWFRATRPYCNSVDVDTRLGTNPAPDGVEGHGYAAACLALAGRIEGARHEIGRVAADQRWRAAGIVFEAGHPAADAGDEIAAGPLMELVVEFWPNHYMALYHAGAARYQRGQHVEARTYLERFLRHYDLEDGWTRSAARMIEEGAED